jgi:hypothetical protein
MQLSKEEVSSVLRPSLLKFLSSSRTTTATEEETNFDSNSESGSTGPPQMVESVNTECWSDINECDINTDLTAPAMIEIIHRSVSILEKRIINVMVWREKKISRAAAVTGTAHGAISESAKNGDAQTPSHKISITKIQREELVAYVTKIASMYRSVLYHNFEHASHVLASSDSLINMVESTKKQALSQPDNHESPSDGNCRTTFGIADNPMMHLSLIFSALVHDVEHQGVGNKQLIDENDVLAIRYNGKSVAENNSLDVSLELLSKNCYSNLRISMFGDKENAPDHIKPELEHDEKLFRNIMYNVIQATDISSQDRLELNKAKWKRAFEETTDARSRCCMKPRPTRRSSLPASFVPKIEVRRQSLDLDTRPPADSEDDRSELRRYPVSGADPNASTLNLNYLRASSVLEQFIQAADVAHSMQSWPIFVKWNTKLYDELWAAKLSNRGPDVSKVWFKGQIGFFDGYINPLAKRLEECGVFGDQGHLFLTNATQNRERWLREGEALCEGMHERVLRLQDKSPTLI